LSTKIVGITQAVLVRPGDSVVAGQPIGTFYGSNVILQVILDNKAVCPLSYMSDSFRSLFFTGVAGNPCR
jgi:septal ring factor EnvC (AmiA/AmiB activator)